MNKSIFSIIFTLFWVIGLNAQTTKADLPHKEYRPYFKFKTFPKKINPDTIHTILGYLQQKNDENWTKKDSVKFMCCLILIGNHYGAYQLFLKLNLDTVKNIQVIHIVQYLLQSKDKINRINEWFDKEIAIYPQNKKMVEIRRRVMQVKWHLLQGDWNYKDSTFFPILEDSSWFKIKKGSPAFKNKLIPTLQLYDTALRVIVRYQSIENKALAAAYIKLGDFIYNHVNYTDAYIAYNCARFYSRKSMYISKKISEAKHAIFEHNLLLPSIRETFPKEKKGIFNYKFLQKRIEQRREDSIAAANYTPLQITHPEEKDEILPFFNKNLLMLIGFVLILIYVLVFVKTNKRRKD